MDKITAHNWNNIIKSKYGTAFDGRAKFRLAWTSDLYEKRRGDYDIYYGNTDIYLRTEENIVKEVPKYNYAMDRWVLEALTAFPNPPADLVQQSILDYNPIWIFWDTKSKQLDKDGNYIATEPTLDAIDQIIYYARNKRMTGHKYTEDQLRARRRAEFREKIEEAVPTSVHALVHGNAVFLDSTKQQKGRDTAIAPLRIVS